MSGLVKGKIRRWMRCRVDGGNRQVCERNRYEYITQTHTSRTHAPIHTYTHTHISTHMHRHIYLHTRTLTLSGLSSPPIRMKSLDLFTGIKRPRAGAGGIVDGHCAVCGACRCESRHMCDVCDV